MMFYHFSGEEGEDEVKDLSGQVFDPTSDTSMGEITCPPQFSSIAEEEVTFFFILSMGYLSVYRYYFGANQQ